MKIPEELKPVLAKISHVGSLCDSSWWEVIYHNGFEWRAFAGSDTFEDGEQVLGWIALEGIESLPGWNPIR